MVAKAKLIASTCKTSASWNLDAYYVEDDLSQEQVASVYREAYMSASIESTALVAPAGSSLVLTAHPRLEAAAQEYVDTQLAKHISRMHRVIDVLVDWERAGIASVPVYYILADGDDGSDVRRVHLEASLVTEVYKQVGWKEGEPGNAKRCMGITTAGNRCKNYTLRLPALCHHHRAHGGGGATPRGENLLATIAKWRERPISALI